MSVVNTRTTTLTAVTHPSFSLRFSDLVDIEQACREDEEQRAVRSIDWISARVSNRCATWLEDWEKAGAAAAEREGKPVPKTPWWEEVKRCVEGSRVPDKTEGWNHPLASAFSPFSSVVRRLHFAEDIVILAVSTFASNPLQALAQLHTRPSQLPAWVDTTHLRYTLIVRPKNSPLSDEECVLNASFTRNVSCFIGQAHSSTPSRSNTV